MKTGCPFWLEYAGSLSFDPRKEVRSYDDLDKFPFFEDEWLRGGICFNVDLDPRWVVKLINKGRMDVMIEYRDHVINQGLTLLRAHESIR